MNNLLCKGTSNPCRRLRVRVEQFAEAEIQHGTNDAFAQHFLQLRCCWSFFTASGGDASSAIGFHFNNFHLNVGTVLKAADDEQLGVDAGQTRLNLME